MSNREKVFKRFMILLVFLYCVASFKVIENKLDTIIETQRTQCQQEANQ